jgi:hypothetical protein
MTEMILKDDRLACPECDGTYLHQEEVDIFVRKREDHSSNAITVDPYGSCHAGMPSNNPSPRRNGLIVYFTCEHCHYNLKYEKKLAFRLAIYQHKGETIIEWIWRAER